MFGRATIMLGIGPHSSFCAKLVGATSREGLRRPWPKKVVERNQNIIIPTQLYDSYKTISTAR